ncbi:MAG: hypothetical protein J5730_08095 [Bacteroidales bacterium]|nr:hypothetical protein [Bacteroidales bacterium]
MIKQFTDNVIKEIDNYVYRLIDPRDLQTFYVGRGKGNRVFQHAKDALKSFDKGEDELSLKIKQIQDIICAGKEVICMIHRYGLSLEQAREVESALIDCYPGLTNKVSGFGSDRGVILADDLQAALSVPVYEEPTDIDYVIIKTSETAIKNNGGLYEATRRAWVANIKKATKIKFVLSVINQVVREVYEVDKWYSSPMSNKRIEFDGHIADKQVADLFKNKKIPDCYRKKGVAAPFLYKKK